MSHIRKRIQTAKLYEDEMEFELEYAKQERIVEERVRIANIKSRVHELACSPKWDENPENGVRRISSYLRSP